MINPSTSNPVLVDEHSNHAGSSLPPDAEFQSSCNLTKLENVRDVDDIAQQVQQDIFDVARNAVPDNMAKLENVEDAQTRIRLLDIAQTSQEITSNIDMTCSHSVLNDQTKLENIQEIESFGLASSQALPADVTKVENCQEGGAVDEQVTTYNSESRDGFDVKKCGISSTDHHGLIHSWLDVVSSSKPSSLSLITAHKSAPSHCSTFPLSSMDSSLNCLATVDTTTMSHNSCLAGFQAGLKRDVFSTSDPFNQHLIFNTFHQSENAHNLESLNLSQQFPISFPNLESSPSSTDYIEPGQDSRKQLVSRQIDEEGPVINMDLTRGVSGVYPTSSSVPLSSCAPTPSSTPSTFTRSSPPVMSARILSSSTSPIVAHHPHQFTDSLSASPHINQSMVENVTSPGMSLMPATYGEQVNFGTTTVIPANFTSALPDNSGQNLAAFQRYLLQDLHSVQDSNNEVKCNFVNTHSQSRMTRMVPPPLHPSPAVLLHIQYVMDSVSSAMFFTDVSIVTRDGLVRAHRSVLAAHSNFLASLLVQQVDEVEYNVNLPDYSSEHIKLLLRFLYKGAAEGLKRKDIAPLRDICLCLRIYTLAARLEELLNMTMSMQHSMPAQNDQFDQHQVQQANIGHGHCQANLKSNKISQETFNTETDSNNEFNLVNDENHDASPDRNIDTRKRQPSCQFQINDKTKNKRSELPIWPVIQFTHTVVSKMPKDTTLKTSTKCPKCSLKFFNKETLDNHLKLHNGERFSCKMCGKSISSKYHLNIHMQTHTNKRYPCVLPGCDKEFSDPSAVRRHVRKKHNQQVLSHMCKKCGLIFESSNSLAKHQADQHATIDLACKSCSKKFRWPSQLDRHRRKVHKENLQHGQSEGKEESKSDSKSPKQNACDECGALFRKPYNLKMHKRVHTGEKPYKCKLCEKSFARTYNLHLHMRTHTGEKPHACAQCGKCFSDVAAFRRHCRTHKGNSQMPFKIST